MENDILLEKYKKKLIAIENEIKALQIQMQNKANQFQQTMGVINFLSKKDVIK